MAFAYQRPAAGRLAATGFLCRFVTYLWAAHVARVARRRSFAALRELDARLLDDVGLSRADQQRLKPDA